MKLFYKNAKNKINFPNKNMLFKTCHISFPIRNYSNKNPLLLQHVRHVIEEQINQNFPEASFSKFPNIDKAKLPEADFQFSGCFVLAKLLKKSPLQIGKKLIESINDSSISKMDLSGGGFLNIYLDEKYLWHHVNNPLFLKQWELDENQKVNSENLNKNKKNRIIIDYPSPNMAKRFFFFFSFSFFLFFFINFY